MERTEFSQTFIESFDIHRAGERIMPPQTGSEHQPSLLLFTQGKWAGSALLAVLAIALFGLLAGSSVAAELSTIRQTCTTANCGATVLYGRLNKSDRCCGFDNLTLPWVIQLYAAAGECLRLHVTQKTGNVELVAIAPGSHRAWRNGAVSPLLKIRTAQSEAGWFLVQVNDAAGDPRDSNFTLRYARYAATNPNCNAPSAPLPAP